MSVFGRRALSLIAALGCAAAACQLRRPDIAPTRMIEPQLIDPAPAERRDGGAVSIRLLPTTARTHIGRRLLLREPDGELVEDPVWRWSSAPDRYLDSALRLALQASTHLRSVDSGTAPAMAVTLIAWHVEAAGTARLTGALELVVTAADRGTVTQLVRDAEPVSAERPGDLAVGGGRLLGRLAAECLTRVQRALH
jgi:hypothetical protein